MTLVEVLPLLQWKTNVVEQNLCRKGIRGTNGVSLEDMVAEQESEEIFPVFAISLVYFETKPESKTY